MKHSIRKQISFYIILLTATTIVLCLLVNQLFLEKFYIRDKKNDLINVYNMISQAYEDGDICNDEFNNRMNDVTMNYNIQYLMIGTDSNIISCSGHTQMELVLMQLWDYVFAADFTGCVIIDKNDDYSILINKDPRTKSENIEMWGSIGEDNYIIIRSPLESIKESVNIANRFMIMVGSIAIIISAIVACVISDRFTKPILQIARISDRMKHLDFNARYEGGGQDEIDLLGNNINDMANALEDTIGELKNANNELQKDIAKKEEIDAMRKEFLANVSHELKTPIAIIQGYAEGLIDGINDNEEDINYYCNVIADEAIKMNVIVSKLLTLNQLEFGNDVPEFERFDIVELINNYINSLSIILKQNNITVQVKGNEPIYVYSDEFRVQEVFSNLFSNATNHCDNDKIIDICFEEVNNNKIKIIVFNTGNPIPMDSIDRVWERFYKVDKSRSREYGGSGIGLSIVKAIMESINEQYGVLNYDNGVAFWFTLTLI